MPVIKSVADMEKFAKDFEMAVAQVAVEATTMLTREIMAKTPVDTSRLISNWQVTFGAPATDEVQGAWLDSGSWAVKSNVMAQVLGTIRQFSGGSANIYVTNNVPYGYAVEFYGGSIYANGATGGRPRAMVRGALPFWGKFVEAAAAKVRL